MLFQGYLAPKSLSQRLRNGKCVFWGGNDVFMNHIHRPFVALFPLLRVSSVAAMIAVIRM